MKANKTIYFTIPKTYSIKQKLIDARGKEGFAYKYANRKPKQLFDKAIMLHNGKEYHFSNAWYNPHYGICFNDLEKIIKVETIGFRGFRYIPKGGK